MRVFPPIEQWYRRTSQELDESPPPGENPGLRVREAYSKLPSRMLKEEIWNVLIN